MLTFPESGESDLRLAQLISVILFCPELTDPSSLLLRHLLDAQGPISDGEVEEGAASAGAAFDRTRRQARTLARRNSLITVFDLSRAENVSINVSVEARREFNRKLSGRETNLCAAAAPTARRNTQIDFASRNRRRYDTAGKRQRRIAFRS